MNPLLLKEGRPAGTIAGKKGLRATVTALLPMTNTHRRLLNCPYPYHSECEKLWASHASDTDENFNVYYNLIQCRTCIRLSIDLYQTIFFLAGTNFLQCAVFY